MKELVVISGKGGTGKTSLVASFAVLADDKVLADCDVDAADLHLLLAPVIQHRSEFKCGQEAIIRQVECIACGDCLTHCRFDAVKMNGQAGDEVTFRIDPVSCEGCGVCARFCPADAIDLVERTCGEWFVSETRYGPMVHARLGVASENSGKLVTIVRKAAERIALERRSSLILVDGPPGIGCPVIASVTGASLALVVTEPTLAGEHDLERVLRLTRHFGIPAAVCVNKWDLNPTMTKQIERMALSYNAVVIGRVRYDRAITAAQVKGKAVVECGDGPVAQDIRKAWGKLCQAMD